MFYQVCVTKFCFTATLSLSALFDRFFHIFNDFFHFTSDGKEEFEITIDGRETINVFVDKEMDRKLHARGELTQVSCNRGKHNDINI